MSVDSWSSVANTGHTHAPSQITAQPPPEASADVWLWRILQKPKNRDMIARLEDSLQAFVTDTQQSSLPFPPRNAFHRRVCYAVACKYGLDHRLEPACPPTEGAASDAVRLVLLKTEHSALPPHRVAESADGPSPSFAQPSDLPSENALPDIPQPLDGEEATANPAVLDSDGTRLRPATFLRRPRPSDGKTTRLSNNGQGAQHMTTCGGATLRSITEEDYQKTRARIFKVAGGGDIGSDAVVETVTADALLMGKAGGVAKGPVAGSCGFERRRRDPNALTSGTAPASGHERAVVRRASWVGMAEDSEQARSSTDGMPRVRRDPVPTPSGNSTNNSGGVSMGRRYASEGNLGDLRDPDFDRSYVKWARREPITTSSSNCNGLAMAIYPPHMVYSYGAPHAQPIAPAHMGGPSGPSGLTMRSSAQLPNGHVAPVAHHHVGGAVATAPPFHHHGAAATGGGMFGLVGTAPLCCVNGGHVESTGGMMTDLPQTHATGSGTVVQHGNPPVARPNMEVNGIDEMDMRMRAGTTAGHSVHSTSHHSMMSWPGQPQSVGMAMGPSGSSPAAYGLDSTVDFPPLR